MMMVMWQHPCPFYQSFHTSSQLRKHIPDRAALTEDPLHSQACRNPDYTAGVVINTYLNAKKNVTKMSRSHLSEHKRIGRRVSDLTGPSPFQLSLCVSDSEAVSVTTTVIPHHTF
jgi:hypothetical protein